MHGSEVIAAGGWGEEVLKLGAEGQLLAIASLPRTVVAERPIVILLNAGVLHRVGPHRMHVTLARQLALRGMITVRLDLGGIGDSPSTATAGTFVESAVADVRAAMTDLSRRYGAKQFAIFGLCSGADNGIAAALVDDRIAGLVLLDAHSYRTGRSRLRKITQRIAAERGDGGVRGALKVARWGAGLASRVVRQQATARLARIKARLAASAEHDDGSMVEPPAPGREPPPLEIFRAQLNQLADRGVKMLAVFSGAYGERYNHRDQLFELFPELRGRVDHEYFPAANHMFTERTAQADLLVAVTNWLARHFLAAHH
jgi:alpha/beta superfamily hydrolase